MALSRNARVRWAVAVLLVGLPVWIVAAASLAGWIEGRWGRLPVAAELLLYVALGLMWVLPLRRLFRGIAGQGAGATLGPGPEIGTPDQEVRDPARHP